LVIGRVGGLIYAASKLLFFVLPFTRVNASHARNINFYLDLPPSVAASFAASNLADDDVEAAATTEAEARRKRSKAMAKKKVEDAFVIYERLFFKIQDTVFVFVQHVLELV
jgi:hypothetical protein